MLKFFTVMLLYIVTVILTTLMGGIAAWTVGLFFGKAILGLLATVGISGLTMWQIGVSLGFVLGFITSAFFDYNKLFFKVANTNEKEPA